MANNERAADLAPTQKKSVRDLHKAIAKCCQFCFNWDSSHARLNSHYEAWNCKKKKCKKIKAYRKSVLKEPTVKSYLLILEFQSLDV